MLQFVYRDCPEQRDGKCLSVSTDRKVVQRDSKMLKKGLSPDIVQHQKLKYVKNVSYVSRLSFVQNVANIPTVFTPQPLRAVGVLFSPMVSGWAGGRVCGRREIVCPGCISETVRCRKLILGRDIG